MHPPPPPLQENTNPFDRAATVLTLIFGAVRVGLAGRVIEALMTPMSGPPVLETV